jgi:hypothetical protein
MTPDWLRENTLPYVANSRQSVHLIRGGQKRDLALVVTGQPTITAANNTPANTLAGDELAFLRELKIYGNDGVPLKICNGLDLPFLTWMETGVWPQPAYQLGDGLTANPSFKTVIPLFFNSSRCFKPHDSSLDSGSYSDLVFELNLGPHTDINAAATGWTTLPTFELISHEQRPTDHPWLRKRHYKLTQVVAGAGNYRFQLDQGPTYRRFLVNTTVAGVDTPSCFSNVKLSSGGRVKLDVSDTYLQQMPRFRMGAPFNSEGASAVPAALTAETDAFGTARTGTIADVSAAFVQATLNNNFRELADYCNQLRSLIVGTQRQGQPRISTQTNVNAWYPLDLVTDSYIQDALDTEFVASNYLEFAVTSACTINLIVEVLEDLRKPQYAGVPGAVGKAAA